MKHGGGSSCYKDAVLVEGQAHFWQKYSIMRMEDYLEKLKQQLKSSVRKLKLGLSAGQGS